MMIITIIMTVTITVMIVIVLIVIEITRIIMIMMINIPHTCLVMAAACFEFNARCRPVAIVLP